MPPLHSEGLWPAQFTAITNLEKSLAADRPRSLVQMATGSGKTFTAVSFIYRQLKFGGARRVLFLVDRANLGRQTLKEFQQYQSPYNHDLAYIIEEPWDDFGNHLLTSDEYPSYAGQSEYLAKRFEENGNLVARDVLTDRYQNQRKRMKAAYSVDDWLLTHAGVAPGIADIIPPDVIIAGSSSVAAFLNKEFWRELQTPVPLSGECPRYGYGPLFQIHRCRLGSDRFGGIFWFDPFGEMINPSPLVGRQIFGHTPVPYPDIGTHWINLNTFEKGIWVFDTEEKCLIDLGSGEKITEGIPA